VTSRFALLSCLSLATLASACTDDLTLPWELDHDRVIAVRATPPSIPSGQRATLDALLVQQDAPTRVASPEAASVLSPASLADVVAREGEAWAVTAPDAGRLAAARTELGLTADAPVPLVVNLTFGAPFLPATKTVWLGASAANPQVGTMTVDGAAVDAVTDPGTELAIATDTDVLFAIPADPTDEVVWMTSTGTLQDFDLPSSYLRVEADDPTTGELVVVRRDDRGGVAWQRRPLHAE
jgi:hypothetical protein